MTKLAARYDVNLDEGLFLFNRQTTDKPSYNVRIGDFDVELCFHPKVLKIEPTPSSNVYWQTSEVRVISERDEDVFPPIPKLVNGHRSYEGVNPYYKEREWAYRNAALEVINRAIIFFKYRLHNPNLSRLSARDLLNPVWIVESGEEFSLDHKIFFFNSLLWYPKKFGVAHLSRQEDPDLEKALQCPIHPELSEELLSDAQSAMIHGDSRRAVLEMAIACETAVKQAFFAKATPAGAAYEYLEDKGKIHVTIIELISSVAEQAFGKSFKEDEMRHYENIDFLFRCRNKAAHRGELVYKDKSGILCSVDDNKLADWWESVATLLEWIQELGITFGSQ